MKFLIFGEILWDVFEGGRQIGGAPFNFAAHSAALGAKSVLISAVGDDEPGRTALEIAAGFGIDTENVALLPDAETGKCVVTLRNGQPTYELKTGVAYDVIPLPGSLPDADALYFGTLAARSPGSRETLYTLLECGKYREIFFDVNIRQHYYSKELLDSGIRHATVLKISEEEIDVLELLGIGGTARERAYRLAENYPGLRYVAVTLGKRGSELLDCRTGKIYNSPEPSGEPVSAVGAGDSFSAALLCGLLAGRSPEESLAGATELADFVVSRLGAIPELPPELAAKLHI